MGKVWVEFCIVSARGLHRSSLWNLKPQWFAVAWVDPTNKYCTRIDGSGNPNPVWRTKFTAEVDSDSDSDDCALHVEVYSRDPLFLKEKLYASAEVSLKGFLFTEKKIEGGLDLGSFQLRRNGSNKPMGFVDVSWSIEMDAVHGSTAIRDKEAIQLPGDNNVISLAREPGVVVPQALHQVPFTHPNPNPNPAPLNYTYTHPTPYPSNYNNPSLGGPTYPPATGPAYPPPPSHAGYVPTASTSYLNMQPSAREGGGIRPGFAAGIGAGALAAGAVIFGDDVISGFDLPSGLRHPSLNLSIDLPF